MDHNNHHKHDHEPKKEDLSNLPVSTNKLTSHDHRQTKRDEWSEGAVSCLLEVYEAKWVLRKRAKLKGQDWEDVAKFVSSRGGGGEVKSPKTLTQCKNKIESMKKRYRSESAAVTTSTDAATAGSSSWPLFTKLDLLMRGNGGGGVVAPPTPHLPLPHHNLPLPVPQQQVQHLPSPVSVVPPHGQAPNPRAPNGVNIEATEDEVVGIGKCDEKNSHVDTESSTQALHNSKEKTQWKDDSNLNNTRVEKKRKKQRNRVWEYEVGESVKWIGEAFARCEKARMETMRELEKIRAEAEEKRGELELKMTQILTNTQLEIAKMLANASIDSSLRIERN